MYLASSYLFSYLFTYIWDLFPTELVTQMKPNINSVEVHSQLSNNRRPVDGALAGVRVHCGLLISLHYTRQGDSVHIIVVVWLKSDHHSTWKYYLLVGPNEPEPTSTESTSTPPCRMEYDVHTKTIFHCVLVPQPNQVCTNPFTCI